MEGAAGEPEVHVGGRGAKEAATLFTHLHVASGYSARYGASLPDALAARAAEQHLGALALTDRDTVAGAVRFAKACAVSGIRPLFGADLAVPLLRPVPAATGGGPAGARQPRTPVRGGAFVDESAPRIVLLARDRTGWANLCALITAGWAGRAERGGGQPVVPWEAIGRHAEGLTVLLGPASEPVRALAAGRPDTAAELLEPWREVFGPHLRLEAVHHCRSGTAPGSLRLAARTVGLAADLDLLAVITNAVRYTEPAQSRIADVLDAARLRVPVRAGRVCNGERTLKDHREMAALAEEVARAAGQENGERPTCWRPPPAPRATAASIPQRTSGSAGCPSRRSTSSARRRAPRPESCGSAARPPWSGAATTGRRRCAPGWRRSCASSRRSAGRRTS
ncbi:hypothetical protein GCM10025734_80000 [Kitasatospora paranensis]